MSYMQDLEARLEALLAQTPEKAIIIREVKAIALESYRNGQKAGPAPKSERKPQAEKPAAARNYQR